MQTEMSAVVDYLVNRPSVEYGCEVTESLLTEFYQWLRAGRISQSEFATLAQALAAARSEDYSSSLATLVSRGTATSVSNRILLALRAG